MNELKEQLIKLQNLHAKTNMEVGALISILQKEGIELNKAKEIVNSNAALAIAITDFINNLET